MQWFRKCYEEWRNGNCEVIVMLAPSRGFDSKRYHAYICSCEGKPLRTGITCNGYRRGIEVRMLAGRLKFVDLTSPNRTVDMAGTFGSMLIIFKHPEKPYIPF